MPKGSFGWYGVTGNFKKITETRMFWTGEFSGTFFSDDSNSPLHEASVRCPGWQEIDTAKDTSSLAGFCLIIDKAGNKASFQWSGTGKANGSGGNFVWIEGDGPYKDLSGKAAGKWRGMTVANWPDGVATGWAYWNK